MKRVKLAEPTDPSTLRPNYAMLRKLKKQRRLKAQRDRQRKFDKRRVKDKKIWRYSEPSIITRLRDL